MAGLDRRQRHSGRGRLDLVRAQRLALVLLLVVAALAAFHPAAATARPPDTGADSARDGRSDRPFATSSGQHGIENRDAAPPTLERRAACGVDGFAPQGHRSDHSFPTRWTRLQRRVHAGPASRTAGGNSSRGPPRAAGATSPLA